MWWLALQAPAISRSLLLSEHKMWVTTSRLPTGTGAMEARMSDNLASVWTEDRLTDLTRLWTEGLSITQIGLALGVSRNAVVGKVHRMGLPKRQSPIVKSDKPRVRSEEHTSELQSLMRNSYAVF